MPKYDPQARERLINRLRLDLGRDIDYDSFRCEFENAFNLGLDRASVSPREFGIFQQLFDKIVWYSSFPKERARIPNYIGEAEMDSAIAETRRALGTIVET